MNVRNTLQAKWLIRSYAPFALDFCPQRCKTRWISKITCLLRTETATNLSCVNRQINLVYYQLISNCCRPVLTYWLTDWHHQWLTVWLLIMYGILLQHLFCYSSCVQSIIRFFYMADMNPFLLLNKIMNILPQKYFKTVYQWLSLTWRFASITSWALQFFEHRYFTR